MQFYQTFYRLFLPVLPATICPPAKFHYLYTNPTQPMKIEKSTLPADSILAQYRDVNYSDCFRTCLPEPITASPDDLMGAFWTTKPGWLRLLFKIRDLLVRPFGLKTGDDGDSEELKSAIRSGGSYRFMSVVGKTPRETVIALDDKHLKAWFSVHIEDRCISLSTLVRYHNKLGVAYFTLIRPFHNIVVKSLFRQVMRAQGY